VRNKGKERILGLTWRTKTLVKLAGMTASLKGEKMEVSNSWLKAISNREEEAKKKSR
jgi:hypothetical protein